MKLYFTKGACSLVVRIIINELGLECDFESVDLKTKKTETGADFLTINSKGAVPTLEIEKNKILTENAVILQYLADTHNAKQLLPDIGSFQRYRVLEWLNFITTELHKSFGPLFNPQMPQELKEKFIIPLIKKKFAYIDQHLQSQTYLLDYFTLPDAYLFVMLRWAENFKISLTEWPQLERYFTELKKRTSIVKSLKEEGLE